MSEPKSKGKKKKTGIRWNALILVLVLFLLLLAGAGTAFYFAFVFDLPRLTTLKDYQPYIVSEVYSDDDVVLGEFYLEKRIVLPLVQMPRLLIRGFVAAEMPGSSNIGELITGEFWRPPSAT